MVIISSSGGGGNIESDDTGGSFTHVNMFCALMKCIVNFGVMIVLSIFARENVSPVAMELPNRK